MTNNNSISNSQNLPERALELSLEDLAEFTNAPDFTTKMQIAFGEDFLVGADDFQKNWTMPQIEIRDSAEIGGANGAYAGATHSIYISREFLESSSVDAASGVLLEEMGHAIDWQWRQTDAPGDEGAIFSALVRGETLDEGRLSRLKVEDDATTVVLDGKAIEIEQSSYAGNNLGEVADGFGQLFDSLQAALNSQLFGRELPLLGDTLKDSTDNAVQFLSELKDNVVQSIEQKVDWVEEKTPELVREGLAEALGPGGLNVLIDANKDGSIDKQDIKTIESADEVKFNLQLNQEKTSFNHSLDTDIGLPGLGLKVDGDASTEFGYSGSLDLGIHKDKGVYLDTNSADELSVNLKGKVPSYFTGSLGFLKVELRDDFEKPSEFKGSFNVDLKDADNKLWLNELTSVDFAKLADVELDGNADINLNLKTSFEDSAQLPSLSSDINIDWELGKAPGVEFNNVNLDMGTFFNDFISPVLENIQDITEPVKPVLDVLTKPIDLKVAKFTLLDLAETFSNNFDESDRQFIESVGEIVELANNIPDGSYLDPIDLGGFKLTDFDATKPTLNLAEALDKIEITDIAKAAEKQLPKNSEAAKFITSLKTLPGKGLELPILEEPTQAFSLLLGQDANLFTYDLPRLEFDLKYSQYFPIFAILGADLSGDVGAGIDLGFGYDSAGLKDFALGVDGVQDTEDDFENAEDIFNGFYVSDRLNADGTGKDVAELTLDASIKAGAKLNAYIVKAGVDGGIYGNIDFNLRDPDNDGKVRFDEFEEAIGNPIDIFDTSGALKAGLSAYAKSEIDLPLKTITLFSKRFNSPRVTLLDFNNGSRTEKPKLTLASKVAGGDLRLNMGPDAKKRKIVNTKDGEEVFLVGSGGKNTILVSAFDATQEYAGVKKIVANGGRKDDIIELEAGVKVNAQLAGGKGEDLVIGGSGQDAIEGNEGWDKLQGGAGGDRLFGGEDDDWLDGGAGADVLDGGEGFDIVSYDSASKAVKLNLTSGKHSGDAKGDEFKSIEQVEGSSHDDEIVGSKKADRISGADGNDLVNGAAGNDTLLASWGEDTIDGGKGTDLLVVDYSTLPTRAVAWRDVDKNNSHDVFIGNAYGMGTPVAIDLGEEGDISYDVQLSTDGTTVVYDTNNIYDTSANEGGLWVKKVDSSEPAIRIGQDYTYGPSISADGSKVAYGSYFSHGGDIFVVNSDGTGKAIEITTSKSEDADEPSISGDGKKVVWSEFSSGNPYDQHDIFIANADGSGKITRLTDDSKVSYQITDYNPSISADGSKVAWNRGSHFVHAYVANADGTGKRKLSNDNHGSLNVSISGDGSKVAWAGTYSPPNGGYASDYPAIFVANTDGSGIVQVADSKSGSGLPSLAADGEKVAFARYLNPNGIDGIYGLFVASADGSGDATLIDKATKYSSGDGSWDYGYSTGNGPSLSSYVDIGIRYRSFNPKTGSGEIATWGPSWVHFKNIEQFNLTGTIYDDELYGANQNDTLIGAGGSDTLKAGKGDDIYELAASNAGGSFIEDAGGSDTLKLTNPNARKNAGVRLPISDLKRSGTDLLIDLNSDGKFQDSDDLAIGNFFAPAGNKKGSGFIETVADLKGSQILKRLGKSDGHQTLTGDAKKNKLVGGNGNDTLIGGGGKDTLIGGKGNDTYELDAKTAKGSLISDTNGNDTLKLAGGNPYLKGLAKKKIGLHRENNDLLLDINKDGKATAKNDLVIEDFFNKEKAGAGFIETVDNLKGKDILAAYGNPNEGVTKNGNKKNNTLKGTNKDDLLNGKGGNDKLIGQNGDDTLIGGGGKDILNGGGGDDTYKLNAKNARGSLIIDSKGKDTLELSNANISLNGLAKRKTGFAAIGKNLVIDINRDGKANSRDLTVKNFFASNKADKAGKGFIETVDNVSGNKVIQALGKNKVQRRSNEIAEDTLTGGGGEYGSEVEDAITDFIIGEADRIYLPGDQFLKLNPEIDFAEQFAAVGSDKAAATSDAYIAYNSNNGNLFYNANGDKAGFGAGGGLFAKLDSAPDLGATDFAIQP